MASARGARYVAADGGNGEAPGGSARVEGAEEGESFGGGGGRKRWERR